jgi:hypothetical protein
MEEVMNIERTLKSQGEEKLMKKMIRMILLATLITAALSGCSMLPGSEEVDVQATVDAAVMATDQAKVAMQATIDGAVQATVVAMPTPTPPPDVDAMTVTEEELAVMIDEAVAEAVTVSEETYTTTTQATSDGTITEEELAYMMLYYDEIYQSIYYAEELMGAYYALYGELAYETIELLILIEEDLSNMAQYADEMLVILEQGAEYATQSIEQLNQTVATIEQHAGMVQENLPQWQGQVQADIQTRIDAAMATPPQAIASELPEMLAQLEAFTGGIRTGFEDGKITQAELDQIAAFGANLKASLSNSGMPALEGLAGQVEILTTQLAGGQWPQVRSGLATFEGQIPSLPGLDGFSMPEMPALPEIPSITLPGRN